GRCEAADCPIGALFGGAAPALFRDALPADATDVLPATAMSCKAAGGFLPAPGQPADGGVGHGVFDTLLDRLGWETLAPAPLLGPAPPCGERVARSAAKHGRRAVARAPSYFRARVPSRLLARVALDRRRRVAAEPLLYTVPVLSEASPAPDGALRPTTFHGEVLVPDDANGALLESALRRVDHLGGGGSRGLGAVQVAVAEAPAREPVGERLEGFARALAVRRGQYARLAPQSAA